MFMQDDERTSILADVEHLLKTPLLAAIRRCDAALQKDSPTREDLLLIRALCSKMWSQLANFRTFSRLASSKPVQPNVAPLSVPEITSILQAAVQDATALDRTNSHRFEVSIETERNLIIEVDMNLLEMVLREIIDNAVKHTVRGGQIQIKLQDDHGDTLALSVTNESTPMLPEEVRLLFERGYRGHNSRLTTSGGAGIGLFLVKAVMDAQDGAVHIENQGHLFTIRLEFPVKHVGATRA